MRALLVVNKGSDRDLKLIVRLREKILVQRVNRLVAQSKDKEAFNLLFKKAEVEEFVPPGQKIEFKPELTFIEDLL